jgi:hypothetical protein
MSQAPAATCKNLPERPTVCNRCGRPEATDRQYWYAMGRLHNRDHGKPISAEELTGVFDLSYCWLSITCYWDGPSEPAYIFGFNDCESRKR